MSDEKIVGEYKALIQTDKGKASFQQVKTPALKANQVLIRVVAAGINPVDWKILQRNWTGVELPHGLGTDVSGVIAQVGSEVKDFKVGDEVFTTINLWNVNSFAEYAVTEASRLAHKGSKVSHIIAASVPVAFLSAWDGFQKVTVEKKQTIYVAGGAGGVGHFIVQLAKIYGLDVISSGGKEESLQVLKELGVAHILDYSKQNIVEEVSKLTDGKGVDFVFDATYQQSSFETSAKVLKEAGTFIILGPLPAADSTAAKTVSEKKATWAQADLGRYCRGVSAEMEKKHIAAGLEEAIKYIEAGQVQPLVKTIGWGDLLEELSSMEKGKTQQGKVVLDLSKK